MKDQKEWCSIRTLSTGVRYGKTADLAIEMYAKMNEMKQDQTIALVSSQDTRIFKLVEIRGNKRGKKNHEYI